MAVFKCKMCGAQLSISENEKTCTCDYCDSIQTVPLLNNEKKINLFTRANRLRSKCEFDTAETIFQNLVSEFPEESEAYWGLCLCKYGIEYVEDPLTGNRIPTCHRTCYESIFNDPDYQSTLKNCDSVSRSIYENEAKKINEIQQRILDIVKSESPYDVFICYKESDENKERTQDSVLAQDIYDELTSKGLKVFFSRITLEDKLGVDYEPYIFSALQSAKVMLVVTSSIEYVNAVWVKNEWSRFTRLMKADKGKTIIPCYINIDPEELPAVLNSKQAQDMSKIGAMQDLVHGVMKLAKDKQTQNRTVKKNVSDKDYLNTARIFMEDGDEASAKNYIGKALDINSANPVAYWLLILLKHKCRSKEDLVSQEVISRIMNENSVIGNHPHKFILEDAQKVIMDSFGKNYEHILKYAKDKELEGYKKIIDEMAEKLVMQYNADKYLQAVDVFNGAKTESDYVTSKNMFTELGRYENAKVLANAAADTATVENEYSKAAELIDGSTSMNLKKAIAMLNGLGDYKDSRAKVAMLPEAMENLKEKEALIVKRENAAEKRKKTLAFFNNPILWVIFPFLYAVLTLGIFTFVMRIDLIVTFAEMSAGIKCFSDKRKKINIVLYIIDTILCEIGSNRVSSKLSNLIGVESSFSVFTMLVRIISFAALAIVFGLIFGAVIIRSIKAMSDKPKSGKEAFLLNYSSATINTMPNMPRNRRCMCGKCGATADIDERSVSFVCSSCGFSQVINVHH